MKNIFNRVLIATDLSEMDQNLFALTDQILKNTQTEKIYLLHIIPDFALPSNPKLAFHRQFTSGYPIDEKVRDSLKESVGTNFKSKLEIEVIEGLPYRKLLNWIELKEIDLVVVGHKMKSMGSGITAKRIARKTTANVLFVTEKKSEQIDTVLVPTDYSDFSAKALKKALKIRRLTNKSIRIQALHLVNILPVDHFYGLSLNDDYRNSLIENAKESFKVFLKNNDIDIDDVELIVKANDAGNTSQALHRYVQKNEPDLVVMGAQGHSGIERFLMGSVTEGFVNNCVEVPVLVVR